MDKNSFGLDSISEQMIHMKRSDIVAANIKRMIADRNLDPGDRLPPEKDLIKLFSSSRGTIRESLKSLEVQGMIEVLPGRNGGARICMIPHERAVQLLGNFLHFKNLTADQVYAVRKELEPLLAESTVGRISHEDFLDMEEQIRISQRHLNDESVADRLKCRHAELEYHEILARSCPNPLLTFICRFINSILLNFISNKTVIGPDLRRDFSEANLKDHILILDALRREDKIAVHKIMKAHMEKAADYVSKTEADFNEGLMS